MTKLRIMVALTVAFTVIAVVPDLKAQFQPQGALGALAPANIAKPRPKPPFNLTGTWLHGGGADNNFRFAPPAGFKLTPAAQRVYDEARKAQAEGFPTGSVIFLDIERTERMPARMRDYYKAWVATLLADERYRPGIYVHSHNAEPVYSDVKSLFTAAGIDEEPRFWIASARDFSSNKAASQVGHDFAGMWQGVIDVVRRVANVALPIDINVSNWPSPSDVIE